MDESSAKAQWFSNRTANRRHGSEFWLPIGVRHCCPCCGYPTLLKRNDYEICELCYWEDDGQDEQEADAVWGGPNQHYSLRDGQENFNKYWSLYDPESDPRAWRDSETILRAKSALALLFDTLCEDLPLDTARHLCAVVLDLERILDIELKILTSGIGRGWLKTSAMGLSPKTI